MRIPVHHCIPLVLLAAGITANNVGAQNSNNHPVPSVMSGSCSSSSFVETNLKGVWNKDAFACTGVMLLSENGYVLVRFDGKETLMFYGLPNASHDRVSIKTIVVKGKKYTTGGAAFCMVDVDDNKKYTVGCNSTALVMEGGSVAAVVTFHATIGPK